jgi:hypothetical protein
LIDHFRASGGNCQVFLTGGDASMIAGFLDPDAVIWPTMTLEGIRLAAETLP